MDVSIFRKMASAKRLRMATLPLFGLLSGCNAIVLHPAGDVALQQRDLIYWSTGLMMLIIVPVMILTVVIAWRYRASNKEASYDPDWDHSTILELVIWAAPLLIIICLGALTWGSTHLLDPYRPIERIAKGKAIDSKVKPIEVQVVALDWKWLFIYPELGIATVNEMAVPVDRPVHFTITASSVMNSFYVPALAGQIYAMPGMQTSLHAVMNKPGEFEGISANYSGAGFSGMHFKFHSLEGPGFDRWVEGVKKDGGSLDRTGYLNLEKPSENVPAMHFSTVSAGLFSQVVNRCVVPGTPCMADVMRHDQSGEGEAHGEHGEKMDMGNMPGMAHDTQPEHESHAKPKSAHKPEISLNALPRATALRA